MSGITKGVPSIGGEHLNKEGGFDFDGIKFVPEEFFQQMGRGLIQGQDILVVKDGATTGKTAFVEDEFPYKRAAINEHVFLLRVNQRLALPRFVFFFLFSPWGQSQILTCFRGAAIGGIPQDFVRTVEVPVPPLSEQERVVRILDEADAMRRLRAESQERTEHLSTALFHQMFGQSSKFETKRLADLLDSVDSGWSPICRDEPATGEEWGVLKLGAVTTGHYLEGENKGLPAELSARPKIEVNAGDVLFTRKNTKELVAATAYVWETRRKLMLSDLIFRLKPRNEEELDPVYLAFCLKDPRKRQEIQGLASGAAGSMPNISKQRLLSVKIPVPSAPLQGLFAARITEIHEMENAQAASRKRLDSLFQSLLHRAFQGEL
ncbi:MAG: hypothetical protein A3F90_13805 [Deltaproteobacteria bacterium RIFCSPLOWO2_12_FULL_60_19]|nr:MAG: hypothetical protein A3F90_13805 [Deltaproteobacteria bacterium RIFCSPLOWO2_12_FULL_60_19]